MLIGYARTSTVEQVAGYEAQIRDLKALGCEEIFQEQVSSVDSSRPKLEETIKYCRKGDILVVTKLDRLARSLADAVNIEKLLFNKGVSLKIIDLAVDTSTPTGRLQFNLLASVAQYEREIMLMRQREGIARAKAENKYKGRKPLAKEVYVEVSALTAQGLGPTEIVRKFKAEGKQIGRSSIYKILDEMKAA